MRAFGIALVALLCTSAGAQETPATTVMRRVALRAAPEAPFIALGAAGGAIYLCDAKGVVHVSLAGGPFQARRALLDLERTLDGDDAFESDAAGPEDVEEDELDLAAASASDPFFMQERYGYVGENVYLDYDGNVQFRQSVGDLFAFPYGTTGEAYLEFTPDSPAFWDAPWFTNLARPDVYYPDPTTSARLAARRARSSSLGSGDLGDIRLIVDAAAPERVTLSGRFGRVVTADAGATWIAVDDQPATDRGANEEAGDPWRDDGDRLGEGDEDEHHGTRIAFVVDGPRALVLYADALVIEEAIASSADVANRLPLLRRARAQAPAADRVLAAALARVVPPLDDGIGVAPFLPRIDVIAGGLLADNTAILDAVFLDATAAGDGAWARQTAEQVTENQSDVAFLRAAPVSNAFVGVVLTWDLPSLLSPASPPGDRGARAALHQAAAEQVREALEARAAIVEDLLLHTPADDDELLLAALELEAANARLLALSGVELPRIGGAAGRALARLPGAGSPQQAIDEATAHLGLTHHGLEQLRSATRARAALPMLLVGASLVETRLDEDDYLDEIGPALPWVAKSALGRIGELRARLTWDLPHTLRARDDVEVMHMAWLRRDLGLDAAMLWCARRRAQALNDALAIEEATAMLSGLTGGALLTAKDGGTP